MPCLASWALRGHLESLLLLTRGRACWPRSASQGSTPIHGHHLAILGVRVPQGPHLEETEGQQSSPGSSPAPPFLAAACGPWRAAPLLGSPASPAPCHPLHTQMIPDHPLGGQCPAAPNPLCPGQDRGLDWASWRGWDCPSLSTTVPASLILIAEWLCHVHLPRVCPVHCGWSLCGACRGLLASPALCSWGLGSDLCPACCLCMPRPAGLRGDVAHGPPSEHTRGGVCRVLVPFPA